MKCGFRLGWNTSAAPHAAQHRDTKKSVRELNVKRVNRKVARLGVDVNNYRISFCFKAPLLITGGHLRHPTTSFAIAAAMQGSDGVPQQTIENYLDRVGLGLGLALVSLATLRLFLTLLTPSTALAASAAFVF